MTTFLRLNYYSTIKALFDERFRWDLIGSFQLSENKGSPIENPSIFLQTPLNQLHARVIPLLQIYQSNVSL